MELKPCPFCGAEQTIEQVAGNFIRCVGCNAEGPVGDDYTSAAAIAAWNKRTEKQRDDMLAALEKIVDSDGTPWVDLIKEARAAIAAVKGGA